MKQDTLVTEYQVAQTANPATIVALEESERRGEFELILCTKATFVNEFSCDCAGAFGIDRRSQHPFVFWEGLFGEKRSRQIQFAERPCLIVAKAPNIISDLLDLIQRQRF